MDPQDAEDASNQSSPSHNPTGVREEHLETFVRLAPIGFFMSDAGGECLYVSPRWCHLHGLSASEAHGQGWLNAVHPEDRPTVTQRWRRCVDTQEPLKLEYKVTSPDGGVTWLGFEATHEVRSGQATSIVATVSDVTQARRHQRAIKDTEERIGAILETAVDGIVLIDNKATILSFNPAAERMFGYQAQEVLGKNVRLLMPSPYKEEHDDYILRYLSSKEPRIIGMGREVVGSRKDGSTFPLHLGVSDVGGESLLFAGILRDLSKEKSIEHDLLENQRVLSTLISNLSGMVYRYKHAPSPNMIFTSRGSVELTGYEPEEFLEGRITFSSLIHPEDLGEYESTISTAIDSRAPYALTYRIRDFLGAEKWVWEQGSPVFDGEGGISREGWITDITKRKQLEEELLQSQKLEAVGRLAGGIAHDFNNLLTAIIGGCRIVESELPSESEAAQTLAQIRREARQGASMTRQLLDFSRRRPHKPSPMRLNDSVKDAEMMVHKLLGEDIRLSVALDPSDPLIVADPVQIEQILLNLSVNARDSMPQGGELSIRVSSAEGAPTGTPPRAEVKIEVTDTGCGMDDATKSRIFEPFFTTKELGKGTGLGLSTVFGLVQQFQGRIEVETALSSGSTFRLLFPRHMDELVSSDEAEEPLQLQNTPEPKTIFVIEDEDLVRAGIVHLLRGLGYEVLQAGNPEAAREVVRSGTPIDLVLSDIVLPEKNGPALFEELRPQLGEAKVLFMSGFSDESLVEHGRIESRLSIIEKPFHEGDLARRIQELLFPD